MGEPIAELWLPDEAREEYKTAEDLAAAGIFRARIREVDPDFDCIWVEPFAQNFPVPGRWYIVRRNPPPLPASYWVVQNPDGSYCEPSDVHFDRLREIDSWAHPEVWRDYRRRVADRRAAHKKHGEEIHREFREKLGEKLDHVFDGRVAVDVGERGEVSPPPLPPRKQRQRHSKNRKRNRH